MARYQHRLRRYLMAMLTIAASALPVTVAFPDGSIGIYSLSAFAKDGNNGGGKGNGNGNGNSGSNGNSNGNSSGNSASNSGKEGASSTGEAATGAASTQAPAADDTGKATSTAPISIRHKNGFTESISNGSYVMTDPKGRVVIDRRVRSEDVKRLKSGDR